MRAPCDSKNARRSGVTKRRAVCAPIEFQKEPTVGFEKSRSHIVDEEPPISLRPFQPVTVCLPRDPVKTDAKRSDQIESCAKIRQRSLSIDPADHTAYAEELCGSPEKRFVIGSSPKVSWPNRRQR